MDMSQLTSRQRLEKTLNHEQPDRVAVDFGGTLVSGIAVSTVAKLREAVLGEKGYKVKVIEPYQMLGEIDNELREALGIDVYGVIGNKTLFGYENKDWKEFTLFDGTEVLVPEGFKLTPDGQGGWYIHPQGDTSAPASGHMPKDGYYFDAIPRQEPFKEEELKAEDNLEEFGPVSEEDISVLEAQANEAAKNNLGTVMGLPGTGFGDIALVPAMWMKRTKGIRDIEEWYISTAARRDLVMEIFEKQCEIALKNVQKLIDRLGDKINAAFVTGTDFGTQNSLFISADAYKELYKPFHKKVNDLVHSKSNWKTFIHSCGAVRELIPEFIDAGFDILNPVQCSATGMDPAQIKNEFGKDIVFWGGGVDTQNTLPFGSPEDVYNEVRKRIEIFNRNGGFVFNAIHNVQAKSPIENLLAMFKAIKDSY